MGYCNRCFDSRDNNEQSSNNDSNNNNNNNNNNNIVVPPIYINNGHDKPDHKDKENKFKDFVYFAADPQDSEFNEVLISDNTANPTVVSQLTVTNIKAGEKVWLNGLFHIDNDQDNFVTADVRIYVNSINPGQEVYRAQIEIDEENQDDYSQPIPVQDVKYFSSYTSSVTYILVVSITETVNNDVFLKRPITFTATVIR